MPHRTHLSPLHRLGRPSAARRAGARAVERARPLALSTLCPAVLCLTLVGAANVSAAGGAELSVRLSAGSAPGEVVFELSNDGADSVSVLRTDTPLAAVLTGDAFDVRDAGAAPAAADRAPYVGRLYKRLAPRPGDFVEIAAGESLSAVVDIARYYDVPTAGDYRVDYRGTVEHIAPSARRSHGAALAETSLRAEGPIVPLEPSPVALRARPPRYNGCSAEQQNTFVEATSAAESIVADALSGLEGLAEERRAASPRYRRWFGEYSAARYGAVRDNYAALLGALSGQTLTYDCTCQESAFAYVFPNAPYDIYMCPTFFRANLLGTDSQAGTIVHELSHFTVLAGTQDFEYGQRSVAALAVRNPEQAIANADSYEYFAENTPALAMAADPPSGGGAPNGGALPALPLDTVAGGSLAAGESITFTVTGADRVTLDSVTGDADLFVFASPSFDGESLVCSSEYGGGTLDVCAVPNGRTHYVAVRAHSDARFEVVARSRDSGTAGLPGVPVDDDVLVSGGSGGGSSGGGGIGWAWLLAGGVALLRRTAARPVAVAAGTRRSGS